MPRSIRIRTLMVAGLAACVGAVAAGAHPATASAKAEPAPQPASATTATTPLTALTATTETTGVAVTQLLPDAVKPPAGSRPIGAYLVSRGTQDYTCVVPGGADTGAFTDASVPEAELVGTGGWIHHFAGPSWQSRRDGSLVTATRVASSPRPGAIPELLLEVAARSGAGILSRADYISRLFTSGGLAPTGSCVPGETVRVPYGAVYVFWDAPTA
ncbi:DUF3455 domain-containing protein [Plantactinospora sp. GCM10030261]|uniref:DUF3455 domain-containing protein n=1 Tax=Plantactinospora sp. GCM10030261 TaxID=3273420 RepID=UPI0036071B85